MEILVALPVAFSLILHEIASGILVAGDTWEVVGVLVIRRAQMEALRRHALEPFQALLTWRLRTSFTAQTQALSDAALEALVWAGIDRANGYGITAEPDVAGFVELMVCHGTDFDRDPAMPWAGEILNSPELDDATKMASLGYCEEIFLWPTRAEILAANISAERG
jgi:hypothetical protein